MPSKLQKPAVEGFFAVDPEPHLLGSRCTSCGTYFFPKRTGRCNNPDCGAEALVETPLSRRGRVWSYTANNYAPPPPFRAPEPYVPYALAAVELEEEKITVLGMVVPDYDVKDLSIGMELELTVGVLYEDDDHEYLVWKWTP